MDWWLIIRADGVHCWQVGEVDPAEQEDLLMRARVQLGFTAGDDWLRVDGLDIQWTVGPLHPSLVARAVVHNVAELARVDSTAVTTYVEQCVQARRSSQLTAARQTVTVLHPDDKATLRGEMGTVIAPKPAGRT